MEGASFRGVGVCGTHRPLSSSFYGLYLESYKVIPRRNYLGAYGYGLGFAGLGARPALRNNTVGCQAPTTHIGNPKP